MLQVKVPDSPFKVLFQILFGNDKALHLLRSCSTYVRLKVILKKPFQTLLIPYVRRQWNNWIAWLNIFRQIFIYSSFLQFNFAVFELEQKERKISLVIAMYHR